MTDLLTNLNDAQREAVTCYHKPSLIVAGAGSGKTRVLTSRIAYMLRNGENPSRILALTFTNKAAREMRDRIAQMVSREQSDRLWMGTFHSIFLRILRYEAASLGYPSSFTIYDTADSRNLVKSIVKEMNLSDEHYKPNALFARISLAKNNLVTPEAYEAGATYMAEDRQRKIPQFIDVYRTYVRRCRENGAMDFDDLLLNVNILFKDHPEILAKYQDRFKFILVDEYQDTNYAQYIIIRRLAEKHSQVCVVGDDAQSIYSFRGAKIENILRFRNDFPDAVTFRLEENYRSTRTIVDAANSVIEKNSNRIPKECFSKGEKGEPVKVLKAYTDQEEASLVADSLRDWVRSTGSKWSEAAILYRTNMQSRVFEEALRRRGIPYRIYGGISFYQRKEIKDLLAYFHLIVNPRDDEALRRVINFPARGIGDVTLGRVAAFAASQGMGMVEAAASGRLIEAGLNGGAAKKVADFAALIGMLRDLSTTAGLYELGLETATRSGIIGNYKSDHSPESQSALDNIEELLNSMQVFADEKRVEAAMTDPEEGIPADHTGIGMLTEWLQSITLLTDMDNDKGEDNDRLTLMTVHAAKGLEFKYVSIVGLEENLFPSQMSMDGPEGIEEERRLFYVALTRAKERAVLSFSETRVRWGSMDFCRPSRFLSEIDPACLDIAFDLNESGQGRAAIERVRNNYEAHNRGASQRSAKSQDETPAARYGRFSTRGDSSAVSSGRPQTVVIPPTQNTSGMRSLGRRSAGASESGFESGLTGSSDRTVVNPPLSGESRTGYPRTIISGGGTVTGSYPANGVTENRTDFTVGARVRHDKFGQGTITGIEPFGSDRKITVDFDQAGKRTLLSKYAKLAII